MGLVERLEHADIEAIRVGRFRWRINTTCIVYRVGDTVIDTGPTNQWPVVRAFLQEREIKRVVITHHHEDHSGNLAAISRAVCSHVLAPQAGLDPLSNGVPQRLYQRLIWGRPARVKARPVPESIEAGYGRVLVPIPTPGHSPDSTCYLEPNQGWLFTGDLLVTTRPRYLRQSEDLCGMLESLRSIQKYEFDTVFCAHRGVVPSGKKALKEKLEFLEGLCQQTVTLHQQGKSAGEIARKLLGREDLMTWFTGFDFAKRNLIEACLNVPVAGMSGA
jgi:glyoxylase-like metal-dependent hydrolase (beta-lactamase superfamily II)